MQAIVITILLAWMILGCIWYLTSPLDKVFGKEEATGLELWRDFALAGPLIWCGIGGLFLTFLVQTHIIGRSK